MSTKYTLREHQVAGFNRALRQNILLMYEQGLGKTLVAVEVGVYFYNNLTSQGLPCTILVITRKNLIGQWRESFVRQLQQGDDLIDNVIITNYAQLDNLHLKNVDLLIVDEAHLIKNRDTKRFKYIRELRARRKILLTATPIDFKLTDLFWQAHILAPKEFLRHHYQHVLRIYDEDQPAKQRELLKHRWLQKFSEYIEYEAMANVNHSAKLKFTKVLIPMTEEQRAMYQAFSSCKDIFTLWNNSLWVLHNTMVWRLRLRQISVYPALLNKSAVRALKPPIEIHNSPKIDWVLNFLSDPERRSKTIVFSAFRDVAQLIASKFDVTINMKNEGLCVGTLQGMSTGVDLPSHVHTIIMDGDYSRILLSQATTRTLRLNSLGIKHIYYLISSSVDEEMYATNMKKQTSINELITTHIQRL